MDTIRLSVYQMIMYAILASLFISMSLSFLTWFIKKCIPPRRPLGSARSP